MNARLALFFCNILRRCMCCWRGELMFLSLLLRVAANAILIDQLMLLQIQRLKPQQHRRPQR